MKSTAYNMLRRHIRQKTMEKYQIWNNKYIKDDDKNLNANHFKVHKKSS